MAKKGEEQTKEVVVIEIPQTTTDIVSVMRSGINNEAAFSAALEGLEKMDEVNFVTVTGTYAEWTKNTTHNIAVMGIDTMTIPAKEEGGEPTIKDVVSFKEKVNGEDADFNHGGAVLISTVKKLVRKAQENGVNNPFPLALRVVIGDEIKGNGGKYLDMQIGALYA